MNLMDKDVLPDIGNKQMHKIRLKFEDGYVCGPTVIFDKVQTFFKDNIKEIKPKVLRLGDLFIGYAGNGAGLFFALGWYYRKAIEQLEKEHGSCSIQSDSEEISKSQFKEYLVQYLQKQAEKATEIASTIMKEGLPDEYFDD